MQDQVRGREADARVVSTFEPRVIPSLLQTSDYTRALIDLVDIAPRMLAGRAARQQALHDPDREFRFVVPESMLYQQPGSPAVLIEQLNHLVAVTGWETVSLGVIPREAAFAGMWHNFVLYDPPGRRGQAVRGGRADPRNTHPRRPLAC